MTCKNSECSNYPMYGVAPHECYWRKPGGFEANLLGTSTIEPLEAWPPNFLAEIDTDKPVLGQLSFGLCGVYFCPDCRTGLTEEGKFLWSAKRIAAAITEHEHIESGMTEYRYGVGR